MREMVNYNFVKSNVAIIKHLIKIGYLSNKILIDFDIYVSYISTEGPKMARYEIVAESNDCSIRTVMTSIKSMESSTICKDTFKQLTS